MEEPTLNNIDSKDQSDQEIASVITVENTEVGKIEAVEETGELAANNIKQINEPEYVYSLIESAVPNKNGFRKNISKRDFALWVLPIVAINTIRRFTSRKTAQIVQPYDKNKSQPYLIKGTETVYTNTKSVFEGKETMRFFGFRFISIWVFPMAVTGAFMEFLFVGPLNGTNPFG
tara:strand:- start:67 stop:591 length:525 start_codon:yes stop_codon:yes gene_type:complete